MTLLLQNNPIANRGHPESPHQDRQGVSKAVNHNQVMQKVQPTMRAPEHFIPHTPVRLSQELREPSTPNKVTPITTECAHNDDMSEVSPLRCGSVPPNPFYDPSRDPFLLPQQTFVPPVEITIRIPIENCSHRQEQPSPQPPEWLRLPETNDATKKGKTRRLLFGSRKTKKEDNARRRRSSSLDSSLLRQKITKETTELKIPRAFSEDSPETPATPPARTGVPPSTSPLDRIVIGKDGRPMYAGQVEELELPSLQEEVLHTDQYLQVDTGVGLSNSFSDSYQTSPTIYESSSEQVAAVAQDGVELGSMTIMQSFSSDSLEQTAPKQPRKGMVRREFQRRFLWFGRNGKTNNSVTNHTRDNSTKSRNKDKTSKTLSTEWKQSSGSCMV